MSRKPITFVQIVLKTSIFVGEMSRKPLSLLGKCPENLSLLC